MTEFIVADLRTGRIITRLPGIMSGSTWNVVLNSADTIRAVIDMQPEEVHSLHMRSITAPGRMMLAAADGDYVHAMGPIWTRRYNRDAAQLTLNARGGWSYYDHRYVLDVLAATTPTSQWLVPDPEDVDGADGTPKLTIGNPLLRVALENLSLGTMAKRLVQRAHEWTGGSIPVVFPPDEAGEWTRYYDAVELAGTGDELRDLTDMLGGPDIQFQPRFKADDPRYLEFVMRIGTTAQPLLTSPQVHSWSLDGAEPTATGLDFADDASNLASRTWGTGGRGADQMLISGFYDSHLVDLGYPLYELSDTTHSGLDEQLLLDLYTAELALAGSAAEETFAFKVRTDVAPLAGTYRVGDYCELSLQAFDPREGRGDPFLVGAGPYRRRITGLAGDYLGEEIAVTSAPERG